METNREIPVEALRFAAPAHFSVDEMPDGKKRRKAAGVAYSGDLLSGHWYWGNVIFDLAGIERPTGRLPMLVDHDRGRRVGHTSLDIGADALRLADAVLLDTDRARELAEEADQGFPWQMSVHIEPTRIEELQSGAQATVNGRAITGPATIFRASRIREVSFTPTGVDPNTSASVFSQPAGVHMSHATTGAASASEGVAALTEQLAAATRRAEEAEQKLAAVQLSARTEAVKSLFSALGQTYSEEAAKPFLSMDEAAFSAAAALSKAAKPAAPTPPPHLFQQQAVGNPDASQPQAPTLDPAAIYAARRPKE